MIYLVINDVHKRIGRAKALEMLSKAYRGRLRVTKTLFNLGFRVPFKDGYILKT